MYDFNLVIEEFQFYQQITPKMQTELIQSTRTFKDFEKTFSHFFDECERGFTNDLIINMLCRFYMHDMCVIGYKTNVKEMYFIKQGYLEVYNNEKDDKAYNEEKKSNNRFSVKKVQDPLLYLPKYSYFGDFQILLELKSNMEYRTPKKGKNDTRQTYQDTMPEIQLMCVSKDKILQLCDLFPQTAENIRQRARERRMRFMKQKNENSIRYDEKKDEIRNNYKDQGLSEEQLNMKFDQIVEKFYTDEEPEDQASQKEDMKVFLNKMNTRIDLLVETLKHADSMICKQTEEKSLLEQIREKRKFRKEREENAHQSAYQYFKKQMKNANMEQNE